MKLITYHAGLYCDHKGKVSLSYKQSFVTIEDIPILVEGDPEGRPIENCPYSGISVVRCNLTLPVLVGYSDFIRIDGKRVCRQDVEGFTNGSPPPGTFKYTVSNPGQTLVSEK